jgi:hypothetical protein
MTKTKKLADVEVQMDRRSKDRRDDQLPEAVATFNPPRRKKQRRRQIDPTTCERDYNGEEIDFMQALDAYKRTSGRMFPTCSEILEVIRELGYVKLNEEERALLKSIDQVEAELAEAQDSFAECDDEEALV